MTTYVVIYNGFMNLQVVVSSYLLNTVGDIKTVALTKEPVRSGEGLTVLPDMIFDEVVFDGEDVVLIPGGNPSVLDGQESLYDFIRRADAKEVLLAATCAGTSHLAKAGVLADREYTTSMDVSTNAFFDGDLFVKQNVVVDEHIVTAQPTGYVELGIVLGQIMDIYKDKDDFEETVTFFMDFKI